MHATVREELNLLNTDGTLATCMPLLLEAGFSARSAPEHDAIMKRLRSWEVLAPLPGLEETAIRLQGALFRAGRGRAAGAFDLEVAAYAVLYMSRGASVSIVHYDGVFDHLAGVEPLLRTRWIVPRGSVD